MQNVYFVTVLFAVLYESLRTDIIGSLNGFLSRTSSMGEFTVLFTSTEVGLWITAAYKSSRNDLM